MNDALREAEAVDPKWARSEQRKLWLLKGVTAAVMLALAVGTVSFVLGLHNRSEITHVEKTIEHSACQEHPAGSECQHTKAESSKAADLYVTCIPFHKAGYPCPKPGSAVAGRESREAPDATATRAGVAPSGGDATSSPHTGSSQPGPHGSGGGSEHGSGGSHHPPVPGKGGSGGAPAPGGTGGAASSAPPISTSSQSTTTERSSETTVVEPAPEAPAGGLTEGVGNAVEGLGETVGGTVEHVEATTCSLAKVLCP